MACFISCGEPEHRSEKQMFSYLQDRLPPDWVILGNVALVDRDRDLEVDAVIIGGGKIWVVEGKCWRGEIKGDQYSWSQNGKCRPSPLRSLGAKARKLASAIKECGFSFPVTSLVIMLADQCSYSLEIENDSSVGKCVHHLLGVESILLRQAKTSSSVGTSQLEVLVRRLGGMKAEKEYKYYVSTPLPKSNIKKSDLPSVLASTSQPSVQETVFTLFLYGQGGFCRTYYSCDFKRIFFGKTELRGASPPLWKNWTAEGVSILFSRYGVGFEAAHGTRVVLNNGRELPEGKPVKPSENKGQVSVGGIGLEYEIQTIVFD
jgi:hypothetical protein